MPETPLDATRRPVDVVRRFYAALRARDADALLLVCDDDFAEDAAFEWPASLPHGGRVEGAARLRRIFARMAAAETTTGAVSLEVRDVVDGGDTVVARVAFDWIPAAGVPAIPMRALESWTFEAGRVRAVEAYYWDTAALLAGRPD